MASYLQWLRLHEEEDDLKRAYVLYGPDRNLVNRVIDSIRDRLEPMGLDRERIDIAEVGQNRVWDAINQYPIDPEHHRLVVAWGAEHITNWAPYMDWVMSRHMPRNHVILTFLEHEIDTTLPHIERTIKSGRLVKCGPLNEQDMITYIQKVRPGTEDSAASYAVRRSSNSMRSIHAMLTKASLYEGGLTEQVIDVLLEKRPTEQFVQALTAMDKPAAMRAIPFVSDDEISPLIGLLDVQLHRLSQIYPYHKKGAHIRDTIMGTQIQSFIVLELLPHVKHYDKRSVVSKYAALCAVDSAWQGGARDGVLETLVRLW